MKVLKKRSKLFQVSKNLWRKYGDKRIIDTPITEVKTQIIYFLRLLFKEYRKYPTHWCWHWHQCNTGLKFLVQVLFSQPVKVFI